MMVKKVKCAGIRHNSAKVSKSQVEEITAWLEEHGIRTIVLEHTTNELPDEMDFLIVMGGDGTLIGGARTAAKMRIPIIGIDFGGLGFLSEIKFRDCKMALNSILKGDYQIEERTMLRGEIRDCDGNDIGGLCTAVNDIVVTKKSSRMLRLMVYVNNEYYNEILGDGIIVSSATGSTAYSLSAGGPIVSPTLDIILISPICPHTLFSRSLVTNGADEILIELPPEREDLIMTVDGQEEYALAPECRVVIRRFAHSVRYIRIRPSHFFETVREKFHLR